MPSRAMVQRQRPIRTGLLKIKGSIQEKAAASSQSARNRIKSIIRDMLTLRRWRSWAARNSFCAGDMFSCFTRGLKRLGVMTLHLLP